MSPGNTFHRGTYCLTETVWARRCRPGMTAAGMNPIRANIVSVPLIPGDKCPRERVWYPQRQVARDTPDLSLGNIANVVVTSGFTINTAITLPPLPTTDSTLEEWLAVSFVPCHGMSFGYGSPLYAGLGRLSGKGPRVIVSADVNILPQSVFVRGGAMGAAFKEEVHPQLSSSDATMHERPTGKVGMYTRFFDYANYRIPFSNLFVSVLTHFRILFSQLSVFGSAKNWNDHFFWVDEFVVPANARFGWFLGTNIVKDLAPTISEYNMEHANTLIAQASPFLRFPEEFLCWVGISRNYLLNKDTYPRFEYENGEEMDLNAFIRTADPRKGVVRTSIEREFVKDAGGSVWRQSSIRWSSTVMLNQSCPPQIILLLKLKHPGLNVQRKKVYHRSESTLLLPASSFPPPKRLRADYGTTGGSAAGGKSPSVLNRLLQDSRLTVEQGVPALPTLPFITSSVTASPLEEGGDHTLIPSSAPAPILKQERSALKLKVTGLESIIAEKDRKLSDLGTSSSSLRSQNQSLVNQALGKCIRASYQERDVPEGMAAGIEHGQAGRCLTFASLELSAKKERVLGCYNLFFRLDNVVAEVLGMTDLQPDVALTILLKTSTEPSVTTLITMALSIVVICPNSDPFLLVEDYENPNLAGAVPEDVSLGPNCKGKAGGSTEGDVDVGDLVLSQLENEARDAVL
ncbi:hypothetical protein Tco_0215818 [Tanacetum coccineum]